MSEMIMVSDNRKNVLGDKIKEARISAGLNQTELADKLKIGRASVSLWEKGARIPRIHNLKEIIKITNVEPDFFMEAFEDDVYFNDEEKLLLENAHKKTSASVDLADVTKYRDTELTKEEIQKIIDYTDLLLAARK